MPSHRKSLMIVKRHIQAVLSLLLLPFAVNAAAQTGHFYLEHWAQTPAELKPMYVRAIMEQAGVHKVRFDRSAEFYSAELDKFAAFAQTNNYSAFLTTSVAQNLATIAVLHCDWNNGVAPWEFAQTYLGEKQLALLEPIYSDSIIKLKNNCAESGKHAE